MGSFETEKDVKVTTAKELKNRTGEALRHVGRGGKVLITRRGKPIAVLVPATESATRDAVAVRPFSEAWAAIETRLKATAPRFPNWKEALRWSRRRGGG
jgi:prevent-host-death family protein